jgi:hypothetical protein
MRYKLLIPLVLLAAACGRTPEPVDPEVLASWDGGEIRVAELDAYLLSRPPGERFPGPEEEPQSWLREHLRHLFERRALAASVEEEALAADEELERGFEERARAVLYQAYQRRRDARFEVTADAAREYFEEHRERWESPERRAFRHLFLAFPEGADDAERDRICARAEEIRRQVLEGASFEAMVRRHSDSANAVVGGMVGALTRDRLRGEVGELVFSLEAGEVSEVLRNRAGCQMFKVVQVVPAAEAEFPLLQEEIVRQLAEERRYRWRQELIEEEARIAGAPLPEGLAEGRITDVTADQVLFELGDQRITGRDVAVRSRGTGQPPAAVLQRMIGELLFSAAMEREAPEETGKLLAAARRGYTDDYLRRRALLDYLQSQPEERLQEYYDRHQSRYLSDPQVELTVYSWPIGEGDPLAYLRRPRAFVAAVEEAGGVEEVWPRFEDDPGVQREAVPQSNLRELAARRPDLSAPLLEEISEGDVLGPYRVGRRLLVVRIETFVPPRQLSFFEVRDRVQRELVQDEGAEMAAEWGERLAEEKGLRIHGENLASFGDRLLEGLLEGDV